LALSSFRVVAIAWVVYSYLVPRPASLKVHGRASTNGERRIHLASATFHQLRFPGADMRTLLVAVGIVCLAVVPLVGHDSPKLEVFGCYQFFDSGNIDGNGDSVNANGFDIAGTVDFRKHLGFTGDFSYAKKGPGDRLYLRSISPPIRSVQRHR
jgi:hypothetical protein